MSSVVIFVLVATVGTGTQAQLHCGRFTGTPNSSENCCESIPTHCCPSKLFPSTKDESSCCTEKRSRFCVLKPLNPVVDAASNRHVCRPGTLDPNAANSPDCCLLLDINMAIQPPKCCRYKQSVFDVEFCCPYPAMPSKTETDKCCWPTDVDDKSCCQLPLLPSPNGNCMTPGIGTEVVDSDRAVYELVSPPYIPELNPQYTIASAYKMCTHERVVKEIFGNLSLLPNILEVRALPTEWSRFLSVINQVRPTVLAASLSKEGNFWPEVVLPFLFPLLLVISSPVSFFPLLIVGALAWALIFNLRFIGHHKIRMVIRSLLIQIERNRRWKYEWSFPRDHLRKFRLRDRYQMPKAFQDPAHSSDDEPEELVREEIPRKVITMYTAEEIERFGYDPANIPMEWIYGDLLGRPEALAKEVRTYIRKRRRKMNKVDEEEDQASLKSGEITDFLVKDYRGGQVKETFQPAVWDTKKAAPRKRSSQAKMSMARVKLGGKSARLASVVQKIRQKP